MATATVIVLGRDPGTLNSEETGVLHRNLGQDLSLIRRDPKNLDSCAEEIRGNRAQGLVAPLHLDQTMLAIKIRDCMQVTFLSASKVIVFD